jgi:hypothetical protein
MHPHETLQGTISLGPEFEFVFGKPLFPVAQSESLANDEGQGILGWELNRGSIQSRTLQKLLPNSEVFFLPLHEAGLQQSCILRNAINRCAFDFAFDSLVLDWPQSFESHLRFLDKSFPASVMLMEKSLLESGPQIFEGDAQMKNITNLPIFLFETLDSRRLLIHLLLEKKLLLSSQDVFLAGGVGPHLGKRVASSDEDAPYPAELMLPSGLLPYWQLEIQPSTDETENSVDGTNQNLSAESILDEIFASHRKKTLVAVSGSTIKKIGFLLKNGYKPQNRDSGNNVFQMQKLKQHHAEVQLDLRPCMLPRGLIAEYARAPGFISADFVRLLQDNVTHGSSWSDLLRKSFAEAFQRASERYAEWTRLKISSSQEHNYFRFVYKLATHDGRFFPSSFDIMLAAQSIIDSNFSYEMLKECDAYPTNATYENALPEVNIPLRFFAKDVATFSIRRFETMQKQRVKRNKPQIVKQKKSESFSGDVSEEKHADNAWVNTDHPYSCSFPDEDIFMEDFAFQYRKQATELAKSSEIKIRELETSLGEGLDIRETLRNWHHEKIMIKEELNTGKADIGSIVFQFAEPGKGDNFSWKSFWLAEQHDNSNLMFYATPYKNQLIGPGIAKSEFGGFAVIPLPSYCENPWDDPFIRRSAESPADALLIAGAWATDHRCVLYIAAHPPSEKVANLLKRSGRHIIYMKIDELPPDKIRKLRTFHILAESGVREYADKYIRKE